MRLLFTILSIFALISVAKAQGQDWQGMSFQHDAVLESFDAALTSKIQRSLDAIVAVVESEAFEQVVLNFKDNKGKVAFLENNGLTNAQIYQVIREGAEKLRPIVDQTMNLKLKYYYKNNSTVGYTYANTEQIWLNGKFYKKYSEAQMARNLFHEWTHKLGFGHAKTSNRPWTIPYGLGTKMEELVGSYLAGEQL